MSLLSCAVITPIGPGHESFANEAKASVGAAWGANRGPFGRLGFVPMPDLKGECGRSQRRNDGIDYAVANGFDWLFFLDADDVMAMNAFEVVTPYIGGYDAVFGLIAETQMGSQRPRLRPNQLGPTEKLSDVLSHDPFLTLQMGHFVRAKAAAAIRFDVHMDAGEDYKYHIALWQRFKCIKIENVLFINRRGAHSSGPRSANGTKWRETVEALLKDYHAQTHAAHD